MTHRGPFQPLLFCDSVTWSTALLSSPKRGGRLNLWLETTFGFSTTFSSPGEKDIKRFTFPVYKLGIL